MAPHARRLGLQPPRPDRPGKRGRPPHGVDARALRRHAAGHAACLRRRPVHAEPARRRTGARRRHRRPPLGVPPRAARRPGGVPAARPERSQPQPGHLRDDDHRYQLRRLRVRPRRGHRPTRLGDGDPRLPGPSGPPDVRTHRREREDLLRPRVPAGGRAGRVRHHRPRCGNGGGAVAAADDPGPRRAGRRDLGRRAVRGAAPRRDLDGPELRPGAEPGLHRHLGHLAGAQIHARRHRQQAPVPQLYARPRRRHGRDPLVLPAPQRPLGPRPSLRAAAGRHPRSPRTRRWPGSTRGSSGARCAAC